MMKFAIISDTHFGDDNCTLVTPNLMPGPKFQAFATAAGVGNDYLILAGDIFDFSIASYDKAYTVGQTFFNMIRSAGIANEIIYVAGNHDADIWHIMQQQRHVINRLQQGKAAQQFEHSVAGVIDDRKGNGTLVLDKVTVNANGKYGGMFLDNITNPPTVFNFVYPNLYVVTPQETVLVTHGQYLEPYWSLLGELSMKLAFDDLKVGEVDIEEMVEMNFPLNQLACTGIGQAGVLTGVVRKVEHEAKDGDLARIEKYLERLEKEIDEMTDYGWLKELVVDYLTKKAKEEVLASIGKGGKTRYCEEFVYKKEVKERFKQYYRSSLLELGDINGRTGWNIPAPSRVIFGHTHQPISWNATNPPKLDTVSSASPRRLTLHNTGGWLMEGNKFCGAEVFLYQTGTGFSSVNIV